MTQEDKELLIKDLSGRLPYGLKYLRYSWDYDADQELPIIETLECVDKDGYINHRRVYTVDRIKPYLFPMPSMNEEQIKEFNSITQRCNTYIGKSILLTDFCNKHHIDWRGLIPMGLAIDATGLNIY